MKGILLALAVLLGSAADLLAAERVRVRGYTRKDGTYVAPHYRTAPNSTKADNWSTEGNINPYTGKEGTKPLYGGGTGGTSGSRSGYAVGSDYLVVPRTGGSAIASPLTAPAPRVSLVPSKAAEQASEGGGPKAQPVSEGGTVLDDRRAVLEYQKQSAAKGNAQAQYVMGLRYLHGIDVPKDDEKALEFLKAARSGGEVRARDTMLEVERAKRKAEAEVREARDKAAESAAVP